MMKLLLKTLLVLFFSQSLAAQEFQLSNYLKKGEKDATLSVITKRDAQLFITY